MGASQSSRAEGASGQDSRASPEGRRESRCYYELLGIPRQASEDEIKKAYRKKALELHPDRNYENVEETTKQFAEVQSAYEILADPQERAWYDAHRDTILRNDDAGSGGHYEHNVRITIAQDITRMFGRFNGKLDFSDSTTGFFGVLGKTFDMLAREEWLVCEWEGLDPVDYPSFGHADDDYEGAVKSFYAVWNGFATKKSFSWEDVYHYSEAPDRRVRRMMEKENKRFREEGIREFNDAVRSLVAFAKKRDPRVKPTVKTEAERQKVLRDAAVAQAARSRAANKAKHVPKTNVVPEWMRPSEVQDADISDEADNVVKEQYECVVCRKNFKSENQYEAHEKSRKHVRAVQHIRRQMQQEDDSLHFDNVSERELTHTVRGPVEESEAPMVTSVRKAVNQDTKAFEDLICEPLSPKTIHEPSKNIAGTDFRYTRPAQVLGKTASSSEDDYTTREEVEDRTLRSSEQVAAVAPKFHDFDVRMDDTSERLASQNSDKMIDPETPPKLGKAKEKRAKKAAQQSSASAASEPKFECVSCQSRFPSKTRLFDHIKDFSHAAPVTKPTKGGKGKR